MAEIAFAAICMNATADKERNVKAALRLVRQAKERGAEWVLLPEIFHFHGPYDQIYAMGEDEGGELFGRLSALARELKICLFAGTIGERPGAELPSAERQNRLGQKRVYNTLYVFGRDGAVIGKYRKTHLFNLLSASGERLYCEEDGFIPGSRGEVIEVDGLRVGLSICYDLRFPELYAKLAKDRPLDVIVVPAAFTLETGMAHWELLLRARAVEQQCYVFAANQFGIHSPGKASFGHSMIVDPWGQKLADTGNREGIALAWAGRERIAEVRARLPALANRRPELY